MTTTARTELHAIIDELDESAADALLGILRADSAYRRYPEAPLDDEPETEAEREAVRLGMEDIRAGRVVSHQEVVREFLE